MQSADVVRVPNEILFIIFDYLEPLEKIKLKSKTISKKFDEILCYPYFWKDLLDKISLLCPEFNSKGVGHMDLVRDALSGAIDKWIISIVSAGDCSLGPLSEPLKPLSIKTYQKKPLILREVLNALNLPHWKSDFISDDDLEGRKLKYPGYHPGHINGVANDEIHTDFQEDSIFSNVEDPDQRLPEDYESYNRYKRLETFVEDNLVWFVLYHTDDINFVDLYALGTSPFTKNLIGVKTLNLCHNLCD
ncbi:Mfrp [Acrasis kona]|uniref:Mfrp n=1 Tax=Acrasis kona TaxID=1008807 RepID=A0AAW2YKW2_9EUKA